MFNVRQKPVNERLPSLEVAVRYRKPDLVILDGLRDLVSDINDGVIAQNVMERLMHLASEHHCCIVCVLYQNKSICHVDRPLVRILSTKGRVFYVFVWQ